MKYLAVIAIALFVLCTHRRARLPFVLGLVGALWLLIAAGCATEPPPAIQQTGKLCDNDGAYLFMRCPR